MNGRGAGRVWRRIVERRGFALLDGGLATELERHGHRLDTNLWSAELLVSDPGAICAVHGDYLAAGADIVISATYQASFEGFAARGLNSDDTLLLLCRAVALARDARAAFRATRADRGGPLVAASVGPYGAALANGAEYSGDYGVDTRVLEDFHRRRLRCLEASGADLLAIETLPSEREARVVSALLDEKPGIDAWISFSCRDGRRLNDGTRIEKVAATLRGHPRIGALGVNCTHPRFVESLVGRIADAAPDVDIVVYPNLGERWDALARQWQPGTGTLAFDVLAERWLRAGARLIGGCCRTTPGIIGATGRRLDALKRGDEST